MTALIGTNEAGKTNILQPLWKFRPAKGGAIVPTSDYPRRLYNDIRQMEEKPDFIEVEFNTHDDLASKLSKLTGSPPESMRTVSVTRDFDGQYQVYFPEAQVERTAKRDPLAKLMSDAHREIDAMTPLKTEEDIRKQLLSSLAIAQEKIATGEDVSAEALQSVLAILDGVKTEAAPKTSSIVPRHRQVSDEIRSVQKALSRPHPDDVEGVDELVIEHLPSFVYYSTYGNLDSEIYLPHVIANLSRKDLGVRESAKARTLKVLFEFVGLQPQEILELGLDFQDPAKPTREPTPEEIDAISLNKKERSILLQSASSKLTKSFREWWKQGEYRFRFEADGNHFRIWVADDKRPDEIELEGRSTGLQWFLSFYLVFLVERADAHEDAILLLDEPGLSLHPLAQRDLSEFFDGLAEKNQLLYTCHSPFLVDADRLDRARKVYVDAAGTSRVTADLREGDTASQRGAAYAVHAALGLSVAESLLIGCEPVIVEGPSDQFYLTAMKNLLIAAGRLQPGRELVFPPAGGTKGVRPVAAILGARDEELPIALFDSDIAGKQTIKSLRENLYAGSQNSILEVGSFATVPDAEVEDLIPAAVLVHQLDRWLRAPVNFEDEYKPGAAIVPQIEAWAQKHGIALAKPGWKVELAKRVKQQLLKDGHAKLDSKILDTWAKVFEAIRDARTKATAAVTA